MYVYNQLPVSWGRQPRDAGLASLGNSISIESFRVATE